MKNLTGNATAAVRASRAEAMSLLVDIDRTPVWHPEVIKYAEVLERDAHGLPTKARTKLHVVFGPVTKDFDLLMAVAVEESGTIKLRRIPHGPDDPERFDVTWQVADDGQGTRIRLGLVATLSVPRMMPIGGVGDALAAGFVGAARRALGG